MRHDARHTDRLLAIAGILPILAAVVLMALSVGGCAHRPDVECWTMDPHRSFCCETESGKCWRLGR